MRILFVASEAAPFAKTGGLADVVGSLPKELKRRGHDVRIIIPFYRGLEKGRTITATGVRVTIPQGDHVRTATLAETDLGGIPVYLVGNSDYFDRDHLYGTPAGDYPDNHRRFALFCRSALELMALIGFSPDIIHCHDWHTAIVPILLAREADRYRSQAGAAVVFTIHNLAYQGLFPRESLREMGLDTSLFTADLLEYYGKVNLMKGGILSADSVTTVSETYREEILTPVHGCGLEGVLSLRRDRLFGIVNGLDYDAWDPASDEGICCPYSRANVRLKKDNKPDLQKALGLAINPDLPLIGMVSRLVAQKGLDLIMELLPRLGGRPLQFVILGTGDEKYMALLEEFQRVKPDNVALVLDFAPDLAPKVYAGSDIFLMPSHFEPCGLGQLIALRYGTVPVVRKTGGLADTVTDPRDDAERSTGFTFTDYTVSALWKGVTRAMRVYRRRDEWEQMMLRGMSCDFSWKHSADCYDRLYEETVAAKRGRL